MIPIRDWLFIGRYRDTQNLPLLSANHISAMLQLAEPVQQPGIASLYLPVEDGVLIPEALLRQGITYIRTQKQLGDVVLVACGAGQSRSVAFAVAALKEEEDISLLEALKIICANHPEAHPHPKLWESLCAYYGEPFSLREMISIAWRA